MQPATDETQCVGSCIAWNSAVDPGMVNPHFAAMELPAASCLYVDVPVAPAVHQFRSGLPRRLPEHRENGHAIDCTVCVRRQ